MKYFDSHAHINSEFYPMSPSADLKADGSSYREVLERARKLGVGVINIGTNIKDSAENVEITEELEGVWAAVGQHPTTEGEFDYESFKELASKTKVVAIGECGLDYKKFKNQGSKIKVDDNDFIKERERQIDIFKQQIKLAEEVGKPLMLHLRTEEAYDEAIDILEGENYQGKVIFHFFVGNRKQLEKILELVAETYFTIGGVITFARDYDEVIRIMPREKILTETDSPFLTPEPNRGKINEPMFIEHTVRKLASIRGVEEEEMREVILDNTARVFGLK